MTGWKTKVGAIGAIAGGIVIIAQALVVAEGNFDMNKLTEGFALISAGFVALGIGHKIEKAGAVKEK